MGYTTWHSPDERVISAPILTIRIGNPVLGETAADRDGVAGMLWTPVEGSDHWILSNLRSMKKAEAEAGDKRAVVRSRNKVGTPPILSRLSSDLVKAVEYIVAYDAGGTRVMLRPGTSQIEAGTIATVISENLEIATAGPGM